MSLISFRKVNFSYGENKILSDFSLSINKGERICLTAPSGTGKTTVLRLAAGLEKPSSGEIILNGKVAYLFQEDRLLPWLTVEDNLTLLGVSREYAREVLRSVGLDCFTKYPRELSGGMNRRVSIARTLCTEGDCLLLDEPFTGIDTETKKKVATEINKRFDGAAMILISHSADDAEFLGATVCEAKFT